MSFFHSITPLIEIVIITIMINYLLSFFWNTKSMDLVIGFFAFLVILGISGWFNFPVLHKLLVLIGNVTAIAVIVIFQPELRIALSKLSLKGRRSREITEFDKFLDQLAISVYRMSEKRTGAIIVLENEDSLNEYAQKAVLLNATFSSELLETIFSTNTPLHDGAIIIRNEKMVSKSSKKK